ncbi:MAG: hypothetical protein HY211_08705 [Candidatus Omnitrophica bacterium]|nr:hypothetical protein [Candidatus Omnitrophota bacterium]
MSLERRLQEVELLRRRYQQVEHGANLDWLLFKQFPLPPGWNIQATELLVLVPPGYPATPPDNFYVKNGLRLVDGKAPSSYTENQSALGGSWAQFSFHAQGWDPSSDFKNGDNLLTFMLAVERRLQELS